MRPLLRNIYRFLAGALYFLSDARANTRNISSASAGVIEPTKEDLHLADIICKSFHEMNHIRASVEKVYQTGEMWQNIVGDSKNNFYQPISDWDIEQAALMLANFFKTSAMIGLWEGGEYDAIRNNLARKASFVRGTLRCYDFWKVLTNHSVDCVALPSVGNPFGYRIDNTIVSTAQFKLHYYAQQASNLISGVERPVVLEIGGGFGGIGYYLFNMGFSGTYINLDIPETLLLAQYFLLKTFPQKKILIEEGRIRKKLRQEDIENHDIILVGNYMLPYLPDLCADAVLNARSLSEMEFVTIEEYMKQLDRICKKYFWHDNSNQKSHKHEIPSCEFPIPESFRLISKVKSVWYGSIDNRFVEFLYEKR